jgi:hypothetical protein
MRETSGTRVRSVRHPHVAQEPQSARNRKGCFVILAIVALFIALYMLVGFRASPGNNVAQDIPTVPAR